MIELHEGAILIADAHYASYRPLFKKLLEKIHANDIQTKQLILMGDIFDLLMGPIKSLLIEHKEIIKLLNDLSEKIEIVYLEGNHDFHLENLFPMIKVYPLALQPVKSSFQGKYGYLAHGDWGEKTSYRMFSFLVRSKLFLYSLNFLDKLSRDGFLRYFNQKMAQKNICTEFLNFEKYVQNKFNHHRHFKGWFIEGHYHQGSQIIMNKIIYHNLEAMACNKSYFVVQSNKNDVGLLRKQL